MIGRSKEKEMLLTCEEPKEAEFVVLYGRRRVGKTYLINSLFDNRFTFRFTGIENGNTELTINAFRLALENYGAVNLSEKKEWLYCFNDLRKLIEQSPQKGKKIVFLDELPWMDTANSDFLPAFEHFWNGWASSRKDLMLIVCGSVTSWIIRKLFRNVGGLFNRVTRQIRLQAFSLRECREYFLDQGFNYSQREVIESYMIFGGIPYYLSLFRKSYSFKGNIDQICFGNNPALRDEMEHLLATLSSSSKTYLEVIFCMKKSKQGFPVRNCYNS
ncbi:MAG: ATP-binding protein [Erysipelotrichaceae bacterium]|jgi:AAA+ ATPase superfamily predicted ATPase|nr:ATP-binding protein [Erysipelotrichaceae bacterium]